MAKKVAKMRVPRNGYAAALRTKRSTKFRHKSDRRPLDARRREEEMQ